MFKIERGNISNQKELISCSGGAFFIAQNDRNNGFVDMVSQETHKIFKGGSIIIGRQTGVVYYQDFDFITTDGVLVLSSSINLIKNRNIGIFFVSAIKKIMGEFGYGNTVSYEKIVAIKIQLPIKNKKIDLEFMERFIAELEAERIAELEAYLAVTDLKDYALTAEEQKALDDYHHLALDEFNVVDIFTVKNTRNILSRDIIENSGHTPYLCASSEDNGVSSYIDYDKSLLEEGNCIFIGGKTFVVSYQEKNFFSNDSHNLVLYLKQGDKRTRLNHLYLAACVNKSLGYKYSWGDSISNKKIQTDKVALPTQANQPNFDQMAVFISAIQKLVIKDVVDYADRDIAAHQYGVEA